MKASGEGRKTTTTEEKRRRRRRKEDPDHADCIVDCFLFLPIDHFAFQRMIQTYIMPLVSKKPIY